MSFARLHSVSAPALRPALRATLRATLGPVRRRSAHLAVLALLAVLCWSAAPGVAGAVVDPFYERLFSQGREALADGQPAEAARDLRLACFGMLEEPPRLAVCLSYLAVAQDAAGDALGADALENEALENVAVDNVAVDNIDALDNTVERILEVERRFSAWSSVPLPRGLRERVEALLVEHATPTSLEALPGLRGAAVSQTAERLRALPVEKRRSELDRRMVLEPSEPAWRLLAVELEWEEGNVAVALRSAETLLELRPDHRKARCLRGLAAAALGRCDEVDRVESDLDACAAGHPDLEEARKELRACRGSRRGGGGSAERSDGTMPMPADGDEMPSPPPPAPQPDPQAPETRVASHPGCVEDGTDLAPLVRRGESILARDRRELFRSGLETAEQLAACRPEAEALRRVAGELALRLGENESAARHLRRAGSEASTRFLLAQALYHLGELDEAASLVRDAGELERGAQGRWVRWWRHRIERAGDVAAQPETS